MAWRDLPGINDPEDGQFVNDFSAILSSSIPAGYTDAQVTTAIQRATWYGRLGSGSNPYAAAKEVTDLLGTTTPSVVDLNAVAAWNDKAIARSPEGVARANDKKGGFGLGQIVIGGLAIAAGQPEFLAEDLTGLSVEESAALADSYVVGGVDGASTVIAPTTFSTSGVSKVPDGLYDSELSADSAAAQIQSNSLPVKDYSIFTGEAPQTVVSPPSAPGVGDAGAFDQWGSVDPGTGQVIGGNNLAYPTDNALPASTLDKLGQLAEKALSSTLSRLTNSSAASGTAANPSQRAVAKGATTNFLAAKAPTNAVTRLLNPSGNPATQPSEAVYLFVIGIVITGLFFLAGFALRK